MPGSFPAATSETQTREKSFRFPLPLHCPCCAIPLATEYITRHKRLGQFGVLICDCSRYPVVADIPILLNGRMPGTRVGRRRVLHLVEADDPLGAVVAASYPGMPNRDQRRRFAGAVPAGWSSRRKRRRERHHRDAWTRAFERLIDDPAGAMSAEDLFDLYFGVRGTNDLNTRDYFTFRWTQPRHLVPLALMAESDLGRRPLLDVGCGAGHVTRFLANNARGQTVIGFDEHFFMLFLSRHCVVPSASFICGDWEEGLPFEDSAFGMAASINTFHFLREKAFAASEIKRVLDDNGQLVFSALRQRFMPHSTSNRALSPAGYAGLFDDMNTVMFDDSKVLEAYLSGHAPAATDTAIPEDLNDVALLSLVAKRGLSPPVTGKPLSQFPHAIGRLDVNPLYREVARHTDGSRTLRRHFPSQHYISENTEMYDYLPEEVCLTSEVTRALDAGQITP
jgi:SAM-dependent methyltransferase/uncharacterized protein YbaR (Trm112 family)